MLNSLVIKNFRMLEDFTVEKLGRVNLIVGKNNSGKSTVLEALRIYAGNANPELLISIAESHDEKLMFDNNAPPYPEYRTEYSIRDFAEDIVYYRFLYSELFTERKYQDKNIFIADSEQSDRKHILTVHNGVLGCQYNLPEMVNCSFIPTQFVEIRELERDWSDINLTDNEEIVTQALQIIRPDFKRLAFDWNEDKRWIKVRLTNEPNPVPLKSLGDGMLRTLQIAIKLVSAQDGFLLIDEFENGLHYSVQENVWRLLFEMAEKLDIQVFATTHSWDCVQSFNNVAIEKENIEAMLIHMGKSARKSNYGQIIASVYDKNELQSMTQADIEVR